MRYMNAHSRESENCVSSLFVATFACCNAQRQKTKQKSKKISVCVCVQKINKKKKKKKRKTLIYSQCFKKRSITNKQQKKINTDEQCRPGDLRSGQH